MRVGSGTTAPSTASRAKIGAGRAVPGGVRCVGIGSVGSVRAI